MQLSTFISLTIVASMTVLSAMAAPAAPACNKACTKIYAPVCAKLQSGETKTFASMCTLDVFNCENPSTKYTLSAETACEDIVPVCMRACTKDFRPVCAKLQSGKTRTFENKCTFELFQCEHPIDNVEMVAETACESLPLAPTCNRVCTKEYKPVCAKLLSGETKTFGNQCTMNVFKCENPKENVELIASTACPIAPTPTCTKMCTLDYRPVCAKLPSGEVKTFANKCALDVFKCENPTQKIDVVAENACKNL